MVIKLTKKIKKKDNLKGIVAEIRYLIINDTIFNWAKENNLKIISFTKKNYKFIFKKIYKLVDYEKMSKFIEATYDYNKHMNFILDEGYIKLQSKEKKQIKEISDKLGIYGRPDYFVWNKEYFYFIEYKSINDYLRLNQIR